MSLIVLYFLHSTSVLSSYIAVVLTLSIWSKINIWNVNCARATTFIFDTRTGVLVKVSKFLRQNMSRPEGDLNPPTFGFMPNALTIWAIRARHWLSHFFNTGSDGKDIFEVKLKFGMLTVRGQQHSYSTHKLVFLWKCQSFWDRKYLDLRATLYPNLRIHAECFDHLTYQGQTFAVPCFWTLALAV